MKLSELKKYIEENIVEILDEGTKTFIATSGTDEEQAIQQDNTIKQKQDVIKALKSAKPGTAIVAATNEAKDEDEDSSSDDKEPSKAELRKNAGVAKIKDALAKVTKEMKELATKFKEAEGDKKEKIKDDLKKLTATKKDLEKRLDKSL